MSDATTLVETAHGAGPVDVRSDLTDAHARVWDKLAEPGSWFTGAERVAIARAARAAFDDPDPLPPWEAPSSAGRAPADEQLSDALSDAVYRLARHAGTLTEDWYRRALDSAAITPEQWVEAIEVIITVTAVDRFAAVAGVERPELPEPRAGEPSRVRTPAAPARHHWVPVVHREDMTEEYEAWYGTDPVVVPPVIRALSAVPSAMDTLTTLGAAQYIPHHEMVDLDWTRGTLTRRQIELVAARLSVLRECFY